MNMDAATVMFGRSGIRLEKHYRGVTPGGARLQRLLTSPENPGEATARLSDLLDVPPDPVWRAFRLIPAHVRRTGIAAADLLDGVRSTIEMEAGRTLGGAGGLQLDGPVRSVAGRDSEHERETGARG